MKHTLTLLAAFLPSFCILHSSLAAEATPAEQWRHFSSPEKTALVRGMIEGSRLGVETWERYTETGALSLRADPQWIGDASRRAAYSAKIHVSANEAERGRKRSVLQGEPAKIAASLDAFYAEPRNAHVLISSAVWLHQFSGKTVGDKLAAARAFGNLQWLDQTGQRDTFTPPLQWPTNIIGTGPFGTAQRADDAAETFYSLDPYYAAALYRVQDDGQMAARPRTWIASEWAHARYTPLAETLKKLAATMLKTRDEKTGLLVGKLRLRERDQAAVGDARRVHDLMSGDITRMVHCANALADDPRIVHAAANYLEAVWRLHWVAGKGLYRFVDADAARAMQPAVRIQEYGKLGTAMAELFALTGDAKWRERVRELNAFVNSVRRDPAHGSVPLEINAENHRDSFNVEAGIEACDAGWTGDTDCIYYIRDLFRQHQLTGLPLLAEMAYAHGRDFAQAAWMGGAAGHFSRNWWVDLKPLSGRMYGDGRFNSNYQMAIAAALAPAGEQRRYLDLLDRQLATFRKLDSIAGLFGQQHIQAGKVAPEYGHAMDDCGISTSQEQYVAILLMAYEAAHERRYLDAAKAQMDRMLTAGPAYWNPQNDHFPSVAVQLADALVKPARHEFALGVKNAQLTLQRDGAEVFHAQVPTERAVIYLPPGDYAVQIKTADGATKTDKLTIAEP